MTYYSHGEKRKTTGCLGIIALLAFMIGISQVSAYNYIDQFDYLLQTYRTSHGTHEITRIDLVEKCAEKRAETVYEYLNGAVLTEAAHEGWERTECRVKIRGENLAQGYTKIQSLQAWVLSEKHNDNLLMEKYYGYGIGCHEDICVQLFN